MSPDRSCRSFACAEKLAVSTEAELEAAEIAVGDEGLSSCDDASVTAGDDSELFGVGGDRTRETGALSASAMGWRSRIALSRRLYWIRGGGHGHDALATNRANRAQRADDIIQYVRHFTGARASTQESTSLQLAAPNGTSTPGSTFLDAWATSKQRQAAPASIHHRDRGS